MAPENYKFEEDRPRKARFFDPTFNLGHVFTVMTMGAALATVYVNNKVDAAKQDSRIAVLELTVIKQAQTVDKLADSANASQRTQDRLSLTLEYLAKQVQPPKP